jgi:hypothetical protein
LPPEPGAPAAARATRLVPDALVAEARRVLDQHRATFVRAPVKPQTAPPPVAATPEPGLLPPKLASVEAMPPPSTPRPIVQTKTLPPPAPPQPAADSRLRADNTPPTGQHDVWNVLRTAFRER